MFAFLEFGSGLPVFVHQGLQREAAGERRGTELKHRTSLINLLLGLWQ